PRLGRVNTTNAVFDNKIILLSKDSSCDAAIKPRAESNLFELCRGEAVKASLIDICLLMDMVN
ncbi:MAG: hypothetical protein II262_04215, partial [Alistipes sp.]|nr:hypothetical protein [Alistipes sp.]